MSETTTISIELSNDKAERLTDLARSRDQSLDDLARLALDQFLEDNAQQMEAWQVQAITAAVAKADAGGPFVAHKDVKTYLDALARGESPPRPRTFMRKPR